MQVNSRDKSEKGGQGQGIAEFWNKYRQAVTKDGMNPESVDWYVKKAQYFVNSSKNTRLKEKSPEDIRAYLAKTITHLNLKDW